MSALDIAKRLIDHGIHPPTMYFPLVVDEALMIEPTECESKETLEYFIEVMKSIAREVDEEPDDGEERPALHPQQPPGRGQSRPQAGPGLETGGGVTLCLTQRTCTRRPTPS